MGSPAGLLRPSEVSPEPSGAASLGGTIVGEITGRVDLVAEIVVLGPDSALKQFARVKLSGQSAGSQFRLSDVPPGRYHVTVMGKGGASLRARPGVASVTVTGERGGRADFTIDGSF